MCCVREYITLGLCVSYKVLPENFLFRKDLHRVEFPGSDLSDEINFTERPATQQLERHKVLRSDPVRDYGHIGRTIIIERHVVCTGVIHDGLVFASNRVMYLNVFLFGARGERFVVNCDFPFEVLTVITVARLLGYARLTLRPQGLIRCLSHPTYLRSRCGHFLHRFSFVDLRCGVALVTALSFVGVTLGINYILYAIDVVLKGLNTNTDALSSDKRGTYLKNLSVNSHIQGRESFFILAEKRRVL